MGKRAYLSIAVLFFSGVLFGGIAFPSLVETTTKTEFCISCHEMRSTVYEEFKKTVHYKNDAGVRATCSDCHVPKDWNQMLLRKVMAVSDIYHHLVGTVDTREKFDAHRLKMAQRVWDRLKASDSRECRNCHHWDAMELDEQRRRAQMQHTLARDDGRTCIDCHKGIAHKAVHEQMDEAADAGSDAGSGDELTLDF